MKENHMEKLEKNSDLDSLKNTLSNTVKIANLGISEWNISTNEFIASDIFREIFGIETQSQITIESLVSKIYLADLDKYKKVLKNCLENKVPFKLDYRIN
jgi:hypothetical protein